MEKFSALQIVDEAIVRLEAPSLIFDAPTKRDGRKVSRKQWMRQNAKRRRMTLKARAWMKEASRLIDARLRRELETLYGGPAGGSFQDSVLTVDKLREMMGLKPKVEVEPRINWYTMKIPMTARSPFWNIGCES